jgi:hypothetical protein
MVDSNRYKLIVLYHTQHSKCQDSAVGIATRIRLDFPGFKTWWRQEVLPSPYYPDRPGDTATSTMGTGRKSGLGMTLITCCYLAARLRMSRAITLIPLSVPVTIYDGVSFTFNISQARTFSSRNYWPISGWRKVTHCRPVSLKLAVRQYL